MRIDVVTIFSDYLAPLDLSLIGKARRDGLIDLAVHDLRDSTHDRHRTVDDTPYGGGAGMVMKPEPWAEALDAVLAAGAAASVPDGAVPHLVVPGPGGVPFTQAMARQLATEPWLAFACGRYEGIDERVYEYAAERMPVTVVSLGDYVLNGGEVAVLAMVEAVARLLPGVIGNEASLVEESHEDGLLEYPVYTKPASWQGRDVPAVLLSGDHGAIARWRHEQRLERTAARRPDLLPAAATLAGLEEAEVRPAVPADAGEILILSRACWLQEAIDNDTFAIPALQEDVEDVRGWIGEWDTWVVRAEGRLVGAVRGRQETGPDGAPVWDVGRLMVAPDLQGRGLGRALLELTERRAPEEVTAYVLFTGARSTANIRRYKRAGYRKVPGTPVPGAVAMRKERRRTGGVPPA